MIDQSDLETQLQAALSRPRTAVTADEAFARASISGGSRHSKVIRSRPQGVVPRRLRWMWLGAVAALVVVLVFGFRWTFPSKPTGVSPAGPDTIHVDLSATPAGWVPYALGDAQISVPKGWLFDGATNCGGIGEGGGGVVFMGGCDISVAPSPSWFPEPENWVELDSSSGWTSTMYGNSPKIRVNEITVYEYRCNRCETAYVAPAVGAELTGGGPFFERILHTLTYSPRAAALASGPAPPVPSSWRRVSYGGLSISAPANWPLTSMASYDDCWYIDDLANPPHVVLDAGATGILSTSARCEDIQGFHPTLVTAPPQGLLIDPGAYRREGTTGTCSRPNGVQVCIITSDQFGELTLSVSVPGQMFPVAVEIGLTGDGSVARTILRSIRLTDPPPSYPK
jgi:hypothetical protein